MNTKDMMQEQISAFSDGEARGDAALVLAAMRLRENRTTWDAYHHIGDVLRSEDMAFSMSSNFEKRMAARLDAEPTFIAPAVRTVSNGQVARRNGSAAVQASSLLTKGGLRRASIAGALVAAVATVALVTTPQLMVALNGGNAGRVTPMIAATASGSTLSNPGAAQMAVAPAAVAVSAQAGVVLRDPRIDDYLLAHQRFSPSVYSTAQYARSAAFPTHSSK
jgi:sigma-E factor negative regulatory protein RseA